MNQEKLEEIKRLDENIQNLKKGLKTSFNGLIKEKDDYDGPYTETVILLDSVTISRIRDVLKERLSELEIEFEKL